MKTIVIENTAVIDHKVMTNININTFGCPSMAQEKMKILKLISIVVV